MTQSQELGRHTPIARAKGVALKVHHATSLVPSLNNVAVPHQRVTATHYLLNGQLTPKTQVSTTGARCTRDGVRIGKATAVKGMTPTCLAFAQA